VDKESSMNALDILIGAKAELERGWCQYALEDLDGNVCALGAVNRVSGGNANEWTPVVGLGALDALATAGGFGMAEIVPFNNDPNTSKADVIALFDRAINAEAVKTTADPAHTFTVAA
jgi:sugar phosphate isomerase/epimerase